jgi:hypothetical protein
MRVTVLRTTLSIGLLALAATQAGAILRLGTEFQVNTYTNNRQKTAAIATDEDGDFVVVWNSLEQDSQSWGVFAQAFTSSGTGLGQEFLVNSYTHTFQQYPAAAMEADGDFVLTWTSYRQDKLSRGVFARRYTSTGVGVGAEFQVNVQTITNQSNSAIAIRPSGEFVVVWQGSKVLTGGGYSVYGRLFSSSGAPTTDEIQMSTYTLTNQVGPTVAGDAEGDFVVAWTGKDGQDGFADGIFLRRFTSAGTPVGVEVRVNAFTANSQTRPVAAMDADGDFVVTWTSYAQDGSSGGIFSRRFSSAGTPGSETRVNTRTAGNQHDPRVAMDSVGRFIVTWAAEYADGSYQGIRARQFARTGAAVGGEFLVNSRTLDNQLEPAIAMDALGDFVIVWTSSQQDGFEPGDSGVFARRFATAVLDVDAEFSADPLTDGLLVLRYLFNLSGASLIAGAVDLTDCGRCTAPAIDAYLALILPQLDIDGDGEILPLTDGLLVARWLFGFTGATLVTGAVDLSDCTRCTAGPIATYLATLGP